jgi:hypothetical protein
MLVKLLIRRGSVLKAKLYIAKWGLVKHVPWHGSVLKALALIYLFIAILISVTLTLIYKAY